MKRFGVYMAAAVISMGISGTAAFSSQAGLQTIVIGGNCPSGNNNFSISDFLSGNNRFSCIPYYCSTPYFSNSNCSTSNDLNNEEYFPGQRPQENCPTQNQPSPNKPKPNTPGQTEPDKDKPSQNNPDKDKPSQSNPDKDKPSQNNPDKDNPNQNNPDKDKPNQNNPDKDKPNQNTPDKENTNKTYVQQVIDLVNEERVKAGLTPLTESSAVSDAAYIRSKEITQNFSHTRPDGTSFSTVLRQNGISFTSSGENIAYGQKTPKEVMNTWMNSSGHRANILNSSYTTIGVGCYQAANGTIYWTQLFTR